MRAQLGVPQWFAAGRWVASVRSVREFFVPVLGMALFGLAVACGSSGGQEGGSSGAGADTTNSHDLAASDGTDDVESPADVPLIDDTSTVDGGAEDAAADSLNTDAVNADADDTGPGEPDADAADPDATDPGDAGPLNSPTTCKDALTCIEGCEAVDGCVAGCTAALEEAEADNFLELAGCAEAFDCQGVADKACVLSNCFPGVQLCVGFEEVPSGTCATLATCIGGCAEAADFAACQWGCEQQTKPTEVEAYNALANCVLIQCAGSDDFDACVAASEVPGAACADEAAACEVIPPTGCGECFGGTQCGVVPGNPQLCGAPECGWVDQFGGCGGPYANVAFHCDASGMLVSEDCRATMPWFGEQAGCQVLFDPSIGKTRYGCGCNIVCPTGVCGDDGCGGTCPCGAGETCNAGVCVPAGCVPGCANAQCGDDGCGGSCGLCPGVQDVCEAGQCVCKPSCPADACGNDGCGGTCACAEGQTCDAGQCVAADPCVASPSGCACLVGKCQPTVAAGICEGVSQGCQDAIATSFQDKGCTSCGGVGFPGLEALCKSPACANDRADVQLSLPSICDSSCFCAPSCSGKVCGDDGCGGSCGGCGVGKACSAGQCVDACSTSADRPLFCACASNAQCSSNACISVNTKSICTHECNVDPDCESGSGCKFTVDFGQFGGVKHYCTP